MLFSYAMLAISVQVFNWCAFTLGKNFARNAQKIEKTFVFQKKPIRFLSTRGMRFWRKCQKFCTKSPKLFLKVRKKLIASWKPKKKHFSSESSFGFVPPRFDNPAESFLLKVYFGAKSRSLQQIPPFPKIFIRKVPLNPLSAVLIIMPENVC